MTPLGSVSADELVDVADWKAEKPSNNLRSLQFRLPGPDGKPDGEISVMPQSDPKAEKVFPRWKAQFIPPEDKTVDDISKTSTIEGVKGAKIDVLDVVGTWKYKERPFDPKSTGLSDKPKQTGSWIMWAGTPYAHLMVNQKP